jgi:hypothetical protein
MIVVESRFAGLRSLQAWCPEDPHEVEALLRRAPIVTAMQCSSTVADALTRWAFRRKAFHTSLIDLTRPEDELWNRLEKRTCRYQINKAKKLEPEVLLNERLDEAFMLFDDFFCRNPFRPPLRREEWERIVGCCDVFVACHQGRAAAAHVIIAEAPRFARALMSATADRADAEGRGVAGALNRWLHWHEILHYRTQGVRTYDLGGTVRDPGLREWSIAQFKALFGGDDATHQIVHLARNPLVRIALRALSRRRGENPEAIVAMPDRMSASGPTEVAAHGA